MLEEHLACPQCGYDLHGIPEFQCPECGFRYDATALRSMAASAEWTRLAVARDVIVRATAATGLAVPEICDRLGFLGWTQFCVVAVAYTVVFSTWVIFTDAYRGAVSVPGLLTLFVGLAVGSGLTLRLLPELALVAGAMVLAMTWISRLRGWPQLPANGNAGPDDFRRSVIRHSVVGTLMLVAASILVLFALLG